MSGSYFPAISTSSSVICSGLGFDFVIYASGWVGTPVTQATQMPYVTLCPLLKNFIGQKQQAFGVLYASSEISCAPVMNTVA